MSKNKAFMYCENLLSKNKLTKKIIFETRQTLTYIHSGTIFNIYHMLSYVIHILHYTVHYFDEFFVIHIDNFPIVSDHVG